VVLREEEVATVEVASEEAVEVVPCSSRVLLSE
jgi:hypothetical protein